MVKLAKEEAWLGSHKEAEEWELKAQLRIGALNFNEAYTSKVTTRNWDRVTVSMLAFIRSHSQASALTVDLPLAPRCPAATVRPLPLDSPRLRLLRTTRASSSTSQRRGSSPR